MAEAVAAGAEGKGAEVALFGASEFSEEKIPEFDAIAFGCPAMGAEVLEEYEFDPMFTDIESSLRGKKIGLFGSYGWGDGQWMRDWEERCRLASADLVAESVTANGTPDEEALDACRSLGEALS